MNLYFLVEGKRTEKKLYPAWLEILAPALKRVESLADIDTCTYYIFSGNGYPSLFNHFENAVKDYLVCGKFDRLVVCLDVDDSTPDARSEIVAATAKAAGLPETELSIIAQECCIETWFLGNRKAVSPTPNISELCKLLKYYNVRENDPEAMGFPPEFSARSVFHDHFFKLVSRDKGFRYTKTNPRHVTDETYLRELIARREDTKQMDSFGSFLALCEEISEKC